VEETHVPASDESQHEASGAVDPRTIAVVGIGASAGGLEVFQRLLGALPADTGFAIVFVQHLDPSHHSMLADILARSTEMPVSEAADGVPLEADHVYVMPAAVDLTVEKGALRLAPRTQAPGIHMPVDRLLRSMADDCGSRAIGVILSGTGSDGSAGVVAIRAAGGVTFAQDPADARFAGMPRAAEATGCVDFVLPPEGIAAELIRIARHPYVAEAAGDADEPQPDEQGRFGRILAVLRNATGIDFALYREPMVRRRILRRLALRNISSLDEYDTFLQGDRDELAALQRDLLIGVTSFFRDGESFERLRTIVFPRLLQGRPPNETIRVWVAGCATGEEAFSIAMSLRDYMDETGTEFPVQIFASDISPGAVEKARSGRYLENIAADLTQDQLDRHFARVEGGYQVNKNLREMCVFTRHNLIDDPPFSRLDLISCRNVLIYLGSVRKAILPLFHYALKSTGFLMLGASEAASPTDLFSLVDREHRIYSRRDAPGTSRALPPGAFGTRRPVAGVSGPAKNAVEVHGGAALQKEVDRILLTRYGPAGVVVDEDLEVIEIRGKPVPYLSLPVGKVSFSLLKLIPDIGLLLEVETLIRQAAQTGKPARRERVSCEGFQGSVNLEAIPLDSSRGRSTLVLFEALAQGTAPAERAPGGPAGCDEQDVEIERLRGQLAEARERFLAVVEAHQASREESQSSTEEVLSANEELQSLNEELETAKEELQSTNEELMTVNDELQAKNAALAQARDFAVSIVETVHQPLIVLDDELRIRMANKAFYSAFEVTPREAEGVLIYALSRRAWDLPVLHDALNSLITNGGSFPEVEAERDFPGVGRRNLVIAGRRIEHLGMILLAVEDVTETRAARQALRRSEERLHQSQKMEAVSRLAGGIAADFNNLLTAIIGYSDLLHDDLAGNAKAVQQVAQIRVAADRAAGLTHQLLAMSQRQVLQPKVLDLNGVIADLDRMLHRLVGDSITFAVKCEPALWHVRVDPGEVGRAIMNLALNARDAMPGGGSLTIETANVMRTAAEAPPGFLPPGAYVTMVVRDTGVGMDAELRAHIFEPFFTTRDAATGAGLSLATVKGIVEQSGGVISCESEVGRGTTFTIFLPAVPAGGQCAAPAAAGLADAPRGSEVVLLVEDEDMVRGLACLILESSGYIVLQARDGREGLTICETHGGRIDLLVSDVVMPRLGGRELAEAAVKVRPGLKVLFMSGHTQDEVFRGSVAKGAAFLKKPFSADTFAKTVRATLDAKAGSPAER
jgi:two-component system, chemotaxis family, CheB/CheR fusion protein